MRRGSAPTAHWLVPHGPSQSAPMPAQLFAASAKAGASTVMKTSIMSKTSRLAICADCDI